jgi:hypothetical protein
MLKTTFNSIFMPQMAQLLGRARYCIGKKDKTLPCPNVFRLDACRL